MLPVYMFNKGACVDTEPLQDGGCVGVDSTTLVVAYLTTGPVHKLHIVPQRKTDAVLIWVAVLFDRNRKINPILYISQRAR